MNDSDHALETVPDVGRRFDAVWFRYRTLIRGCRHDTAELKQMRRSLGYDLLQIRTDLYNSRRADGSEIESFDHWLKRYRFPRASAYRYIRIVEPPLKPPKPQRPHCLQMRGCTVTLPLTLRQTHIARLAIAWLKSVNRPAAEILDRLARSIAPAGAIFLRQQLDRIRERRDISFQLLQSFAPIIIPLRI